MNEMNAKDYLAARAEFHHLVDKPATDENIARLAEITREMAEHDGLEPGKAEELETNVKRLSEITRQLPWEYRLAMRHYCDEHDPSRRMPASRIAVWGLGIFAFLLIAGMALAYLFPDGLWPLNRW